MERRDKQPQRDGAQTDGVDRDVEEGERSTETRDESARLSDRGTDRGHGTAKAAEQGEGSKRMIEDQHQRTPPNTAYELYRLTRPPAKALDGPPQTLLHSTLSRMPPHASI